MRRPGADEDARYGVERLATIAVLVPDGYEPYGWYWFPGAGLSSVAKLGRVHLREAGVDGRTLCGRHRSDRRGAKQMGGVDMADAARESGVCERCWLRAAEALHKVTFQSHRTGVSNRYGRGSSGSGGRVTRWRCSCGLENRANWTLTEQRRNVRDHVRNVVYDGLWRLERERYEPVIVDFPATPAVELTYGVADVRAELEAARMSLRGLAVGESVSGQGRTGVVRVTRVAMPLLPGGDPRAAA